MLWVVAQRLLVALPTFFGITLVSFVGIRLAPGDPVRTSLDPLIAGGPDGEAYIALRRHELGLDQPLPVQYIDWLRAVLKGDFGYSFATGQPVLEIIRERLAPTMELMATALAIALVIGVVIGVATAFRQYSMFDYVATFASLFAISIPQFFLALIAILVFAVTLRVLPVGGMTTLGGQAGLGDSLAHLVLPASILGLTFAGPFVRYTRASVLETIHKEYILAARAKGLSETRVAFRHALPNALLPLVALVGLQVPYLVAGAVVVETVFQWPGMGQLLLTAFQELDYPVLSGFVMVLALFVFTGLLVSEVLYGVLDPRIRRS
jgi:peptide/nickel transport system permease protein